MLAFSLLAAVLASAPPAWVVGGGEELWQVSVDPEGARLVHARNGDEVRIGAATLWREGWRHPVSGASALLERDSQSVRLGSGLAVERWVHHADRGEIEQRWELAGPPPGRGPLEVSVPVAGLRWMGEDEAGLQFEVSGSSASGLRYGHGLLIDRLGQRFDVPARHEEGRVRLTVPEATLARGAWPAVLDPTVSALAPMLPELPNGTFGRAFDVTWNGSEYVLAWRATSWTWLSRLSPMGEPLATPRRLGEVYSQYRPSISAAPGGMLAVFPNGSFAGETQSPGESNGIHLHPDGTLASTVPFRIGNRWGADRVDLQWTGTHFVAAWANRVARATLNGVLDPEGLPIPGISDLTYPVATATANGITLVVAKGLTAQRVNLSTGTWLDTDPLPLGPVTYAGFAVATNGTDFLVAWQHAGQVRFARVTANGALLDQPGVVVGTHAHVWDSVSVAFNGTDYLIAYAHHPSPAAPVHTVRVIRVSPSGVVDPQPALELPIAHHSLSATTGNALKLARGGSGFLLAMEYELPLSTPRRRIRGLPLELDGTVAGPLRTIGTHPARDQGSFVASSSEPAGAWVEERLDGPQVFFTRFDATGAPLHSGVALSQSDQAPTVHAVAHDGTHHVVLWSEEPAGPSAQATLKLARVDAQGVALHAAPVTVAAPVSAAAQLTGRVGLACGNGQCLVTWPEQGALRAARISSAGAVLDPGGLSLPVSEGPPGWTSAGFLVVGSADGALRVVQMDLAGGLTWRDEGAALSHLVLSCRPLRCTAVGKDSAGVLRSLHLEIAAGALTATRHAVGPQGLPNLPVALLWDGQVEWLAVDAGGLRAVRLVNGVRVEPLTDVLPPPAAGAGPRRLMLLEQGVAMVTELKSTCLPYYPCAQRIQSAVVRFDEPLVLPATFEGDEDVPLPLTFTGMQAQHLPLTFNVATPPERGTVSALGAGFLYTPEPDFHGEVIFTVTATDGTRTSAPSLQRILLRPVNDAPQAHPLKLATLQGKVLTGVALPGTDVDGDALTFSVVAPDPAVGTITQEGPSTIRFEPARGFRGSASIPFAVSDGVSNSANTASIVVINAAPTALARVEQSPVSEGSAVTFIGSGEDEGGDALTFTWRLSDGTVADGERLTHVFPHHGTWDAQLVVSDGEDEGTHSLSVTVENVPPEATALHALPGQEGTAVRVWLDFTDPGSGDQFRFRWGWADGIETVTEAPEVHRTFADDVVMRVSVVVEDSAGAQSERFFRDVEIRNVPPTPVEVGPLEVLRGESGALQLEATDPGGENDPLSWRLVDGPGTVEAATGRYVVETSGLRRGVHAVTVEVSDDDGGTAQLGFAVNVTGGAAVGCACVVSGEGGASGAVVLLVALGLMLRPRRARAPSSRG